MRESPAELRGRPLREDDPQHSPAPPRHREVLWPALARRHGRHGPRGSLAYGSGWARDGRRSHGPRPRPRRAHRRHEPGPSCRSDVMTFKLIREPKMPTMAEVATRTADQWRSCERLALDRLRRAT